MITEFYVDAHCHLDLFPEIQSRAGNENSLPIKTVTVTNSPAFFQPNMNLFSKLENIRVALGLHPELAAQYQNEINLFEKNISVTKYIGEIGLDGSKDYHLSYNIQFKVFNSILSLAKSADNKILTVHSRNAAKETIERINYYLKNTNCKIIMHWFSGSLADLKTAINNGYFFSINHKMANAEKGREMIARIPVAQLLTETDAPFTFDNKITNRMDSLIKTVEVIGAIKKIDKAAAQQKVLENFRQLLSQ